MSKNSTQVINENALFYSLRLKRDKGNDILMPLYYSIINLILNL